MKYSHMKLLLHLPQIKSCSVTVFPNSGTQSTSTAFISFAVQRPTTARAGTLTPYSAYEQLWHCKTFQSEHVQEK